MLGLPSLLGLIALFFDSFRRVILEFLLSGGLTHPVGLVVCFTYCWIVSYVYYATRRSKLEAVLVTTFISLIAVVANLFLGISLMVGGCICVSSLQQRHW